MNERGVCKWDTALRIKGLKISKMIAMGLAMTFSNGPIGGQYAYGHTGYSTSIVSAYTKHEVVDYKHVEVKSMGSRIMISM